MKTRLFDLNIFIVTNACKLHLFCTLMIIFFFYLIHFSLDIPVAFCEANNPLEESNNKVLGSFMFISSIVLYIWLAPIFFPYVDPDILMTAGAEIINNNTVLLNNFEIGREGLFIDGIRIDTSNVYLNAEQSIKQALLFREDVIEKFSQRFDPQLAEYDILKTEFEKLFSSYQTLQHKYTYLLNYKVFFIDSLKRADVFPQSLEDMYHSLVAQKQESRFHEVLALACKDADS